MSQYSWKLKINKKFLVSKGNYNLARQEYIERLLLKNTVRKKFFKRGLKERKDCL